MGKLRQIVLVLIAFSVVNACGTGGDVVQVFTVSEGDLSGIGETEKARLAEIKAEKRKSDKDIKLESVIQTTPNYSVSEYLAANAGDVMKNDNDYQVGGYDMLDIIVYEEEDLCRDGVRVSADGFISFPLINRLRVADLTTGELEALISQKLAQGQFLLDAHVSVTVSEFKSKQYMVLGSVKQPGAYPLQANEHVLDAVSRSGGIDFEQGGKKGMIIRSENYGTVDERKIVIRIDLPGLLKGGDQLSNLALMDRDLFYIPKAEFLYIIGQVQKPGSYPYLEKEISLVEALSKAGGFTQIAARNKTRIIRVENGIEKIIHVKVDAITKSGKKAQDVKILPGDVIVVPESFF